MTRARWSPRPVTLALDGVRAELAPETLLAEIQGVWADVVGDAIAAQARPVAERAGVLTVSCAASVWAQELDLMAPELIGRLNGALKRGSIARLRCVTTPPRGD